jgi:hypothetical protein
MTQEQKPGEDGEVRKAVPRQDSEESSNKEPTPEASSKRKHPLLLFKRLDGRDTLKYEDVADK